MSEAATTRARALLGRGAGPTRWGENCERWYPLEAQIAAAAEFLTAALAQSEEAIAPSEPEPSTGGADALRAELAALKTGALNKRAREAGVDADAMDDAADADDPKEALIALIVAAVGPAEAAEPAPDPSAALRESLPVS